MQEKEIGAVELGVKSAKVASLVALTQIVSIFIGGFMLIALARLLQPAQYGVYTLALGVSSFFSAFGLLGINDYLNRYIPIWSAKNKRSELRRDLGTGILVLLTISLIGVLIGIALSGPISMHVFHSTVSYVLVIDASLVSALFMLFMFLVYNALIGFKDGIGSALTFSMGNLAIAIASITLVLLGYGVLGALSGAIIGSACGIVIGFFYLAKHSKIEFDLRGFTKRAKRILFFSLPLVGREGVGNFVSSFSIIFLGVFSSSIILGSFGVAYNIGTIINTALLFVGSVLVQMFSSALASRKSKEAIGKFYNYSVYFGLMLCIPIVVYLTVFARPIVISLFPNFTSAVLYIPAICASFVVGTIGLYAASLAVSEGKPKTVLKYAILTGIVQVILLLILVPRLNAYGVIVGVYFAGSIVSDYLYMRYMKKELHITLEFGRIARIVLASVILAALLYPINLIRTSQTVQLAIGIVAVLLIYPILLGLSRAIGKKEVGLLQMIGKGTPRMGILFDYLASYISIFIR